MKRNLTELEAGSTTVGSCWLAPLVEAGEGVNLSFIFKRQSKEKILSRIAQTTMVNRSRMRDVGNTRQGFEELDSAISSGLYLKDAMNRRSSPCSRFWPWTWSASPGATPLPPEQRRPSPSPPMRSATEMGYFRG